MMLPVLRAAPGSQGPECKAQTGVITHFKCKVFSMWPDRTGEKRGTSPPPATLLWKPLLIKEYSLLLVHLEKEGQETLVPWDPT